MKYVWAWALGLCVILVPATAPAPISGAFESLNRLIDDAEFIVIAQILKRPDELDTGGGGIFEIEIVRALKGGVEKGKHAAAYLRDLPFGLPPGKFTSLTHEFIQGQLYLLFLNSSKGQVRQNDKPLPVDFVNENSSGDAIWITQSSIYGWFDLDRLQGKTVREAVVAVLTNTANQQRGIAAAIDRIIESHSEEISIQRVTQTLWFDSNAREAVTFYLSVFKDAHRDANVAQFVDVLPDAKLPVTGASFAIEGQQFIALNAGPELASKRANFLTLNCRTQEEIDYYWDKLSAGGEKSRGGWVKDKFGVSWHVVPYDLALMVGGIDPRSKAQHVIDATLKMEKLDARELKRAWIESMELPAEGKR